MQGKCPWYNDGMCFSPKALREFGEPTDKPVSSICVSSHYTTCRYYVERRGGEEPSLEAFEGSVTGMKTRIERLYYPIHTLPPNIKSECPFFILSSVRDESGNTIYVAQCKVLGRFLTRSHALKCASYWRECPFYLMGLHKELV